DDVVAPKSLLGLGEGSVGGEALPVLHRDGRRGLRALQRVTGDELLAVDDGLREGPVLLPDGALGGIVELRPRARVADDQQHVLHGVLRFGRPGWPAHPNDERRLTRSTGLLGSPTLSSGSDPSRPQILSPAMEL